MASCCRRPSYLTSRSSPCPIRSAFRAFRGTASRVCRLRVYGSTIPTHVETHKHPSSSTVSLPPPLHLSARVRSNPVTDAPGFRITSHVEPGLDHYTVSTAELHRAASWLAKAFHSRILTVTYRDVPKARGPLPDLFAEGRENNGAKHRHTDAN